MSNYNLKYLLDLIKNSSSIDSLGWVKFTTATKSIVDKYPDKSLIDIQYYPDIDDRQISGLVRISDKGKIVYPYL